MRLAQSWLDRTKGSINQSRLESQLIQSIRDLSIEYIHIPGTVAYDEFPTARKKIDLNDRTIAEIVLEHGFDSNITDSATIETYEMLEVRGLTSGSNRWSYIELFAMFMGVVKYGPGKWKLIKDDHDLKRYLNCRTSKSMGTKWRDLNLSKIVFFNSSIGHGRWFVAEEYRDQYPEFHYAENGIEYDYWDLAMQNMQNQGHIHSAVSEIRPFLESNNLHSVTFPVAPYQDILPDMQEIVSDVNENLQVNHEIIPIGPNFQNRPYVPSRGLDIRPFIEAVDVSSVTIPVNPSQELIMVNQEIHSVNQIQDITLEGNCQNFKNI
jgi:hypothetical protein